LCDRSICPGYDKEFCLDRDIAFLYMCHNRFEVRAHAFARSKKCNIEEFLHNYPNDMNRSDSIL